MIKRLFIVVFFLLPCLCIAQVKPLPVTMQMRDGKIYFDNTYALDANLKKEELFNNALSWFKQQFLYADKGVNVVDEKNGEISGTGIFKIITSTSGHYYWIKFTVNIIVHNATYELKAVDFYEKPIESGVSNEYSKIEYRWWDYRQGKPWSGEDKMLFNGLYQNINTMMDSLEKALNK